MSSVSIQVVRDLNDVLPAICNILKNPRFDADKLSRYISKLLTLVHVYSSDDPQSQIALRNFSMETFPLFIEVCMDFVEVVDDISTQTVISGAIMATNKIMIQKNDGAPTLPVNLRFVQGITRIAAWMPTFTRSRRKLLSTLKFVAMHLKGINVVDIGPEFPPMFVYNVGKLMCDTSDSIVNELTNRDAMGLSHMLTDFLVFRYNLMCINGSNMCEFVSEIIMSTQDLAYKAAKLAVVAIACTHPYNSPGQAPMTLSIFEKVLENNTTEEDLPCLTNDSRVMKSLHICSLVYPSCSTICDNLVRGMVMKFTESRYNVAAMHTALSHSLDKTYNFMRGFQFENTTHIRDTIVHIICLSLANKCAVQDSPMLRGLCLPGMVTGLHALMRSTPLFTSVVEYVPNIHSEYVLQSAYLLARLCLEETENESYKTELVKLLWTVKKLVVYRTVKQWNIPFESEIAAVALAETITETMHIFLAKSNLDSFSFQVYTISAVTLQSLMRMLENMRRVHTHEVDNGRFSRISADAERMNDIHLVPNCDAHPGEWGICLENHLKIFGSVMLYGVCKNARCTNIDGMTEFIFPSVGTSEYCAQCISQLNRT